MTNYTSLKNLTLIMPTYNRRKYAKRSINFWSGTNVNLIVLDGSVHPLELNFTSKLPPNIKYVHKQNSWIDRIFLGSNLTATPFAMLICDDEFYLPSALDLFITELNSNETVKSVNGIAVAFYPFTKHLYFRRIYKNFRDASIEFDDPVKRVEKHMMPYAVTGLYGMHRTEIFKKNVEVAKICSSLPDPASFELGFEIANSYQGKTRVLPIVSWLRSMENPPIWNTHAIQTHVLWQNKMLRNLPEVSSATEKILKPSNEIENTLEKQILYKGLECYVSNFSTSNKREKTYFIKTQIKNVIPYQLYFFFIWLILSISKKTNLTTWISRKSLLRQLDVEKVMISKEDLDKIENNLRSRLC
jgi:glycosyltransferase domain-containing protein